MVEAILFHRLFTSFTDGVSSSKGIHLKISSRISSGMSSKCTSRRDGSMSEAKKYVLVEFISREREYF